MGSIGDMAALLGIASNGQLSDRRRWRWRAATSQLLRGLFLEICSASRIDLLVEIGAHEAFASRTFVQTGQGKAVAYEANPSTVDMYARDLSQAGIDLRLCAITDFNGTALLLIPSFGDIPSNESDTPAQSSLLRYSEATSESRVSVPARTLDSEGSTWPTWHRGALWIDAEGTSEAVIEGATNLLASGAVRVVLVEVESAGSWPTSAGCASRVTDSLEMRGMTLVARDAEFEGQCNSLHLHQDDLYACEELVMEYWSRVCRVKVPWWATALDAAKSRLRTSL